MKHINDLELKHAFIVNDKFIAIKADKRNVLSEKGFNLTYNIQAKKSLLAGV